MSSDGTPSSTNGRGGNGGQKRDRDGSEKPEHAWALHTSNLLNTCEKCNGLHEKRTAIYFSTIRIADPEKLLYVPYNCPCITGLSIQTKLDLFDNGHIRILVNEKDMRITPPDAILLKVASEEELRDFWDIWGVYIQHRSEYKRAVYDIHNRRFFFEKYPDTYESWPDEDVHDEALIISAMHGIANSKLWYHLPAMFNKIHPNLTDNKDFMLRLFDEMQKNAMLTRYPPREVSVRMWLFSLFLPILSFDLKDDMAFWADMLYVLDGASLKDETIEFVERYMSPRLRYLGTKHSVGAYYMRHVIDMNHGFLGEMPLHILKELEKLMDTEPFTDPKTPPPPSSP